MDVVLASDVEAGRYLCVATSSPFGALIRVATKSVFDHTILSIGGGKIIEATTGHGVIVSPLAKYHGHRAIVCTDTMGPTQRAAVVKTAIGLSGDPYNFASVGYQGLAYLTGWHWALLLRLACGRHVFDCSQAAAYCGETAGLDWSCGQRINALVTPAMLAVRPTVAPIAWH